MQETMQGMSDTTLGLIVMPFFLTFIFALGYVIYRVKNAALTRAWTPLLPVLDGGRGAVGGDGGGAATSFLGGTYGGRPIRASASPDVAKYSGESGHYANRFTVALTDVPGAANFRITAAPTLLQFARGDVWRIDAKPDALRAALEATPAIAMVSAMGDVEVCYDRAGRMLRMEEDVRPLTVAPPERFRETLELLIALADLTSPLNRG